MKRMLLAFILCASAVGAVEPDEILSDPILEARARDISADLRCVVCQNEPIDTSNAGVARDLRLLVRERLIAGDTNEQVFEYVVARYGDYVLLNPPWKSTTYVLWLNPAFLAFFGVFLVVGIFRRSNLQQTKVEVLNLEEEAQFSEATKRQAERDTH